MDISQKKAVIEQALQSDIRAEAALKIVKNLLKAAAESDNFTAEIKVKVNDSKDKSAPDFCAVCVITPLGSVCIAPPGGSC